MEIRMSEVLTRTLARAFEGEIDNAVRRVLRRVRVKIERNPDRHEDVVTIDLAPMPGEGGNDAKG